MSESSFIDLDAFAAAVRRRLSIALLVAAFVGVAAGTLYALFGRLTAEGVYQIGTLEINEKKIPQLQYQRGIPPQEYKTYAPRFDGNAFSEFAARLPDADPVVVARVERELRIESRRLDLMSPIYGTTRGDLRELGETAKMPDNVVLGLRIAHAARDRDLALAVVDLAGRFAGDTVFRTALRDVTLLRSRESAAQRLLAENVLINARFATEQLESKGRTLEKLRSAFPELVKGTPQQVISVVEGGQRYLSPSAQVVGVESTIADNREKIGVAERNMRKADLQRAYYDRVLKLLEQPITSEAMLAAFPGLIKGAFPEGTDPDGSVAEARNEALIELGAIAALRQRGLQFIVAPAIVEREPVKVAAVGVGTAIAALLAAALVLLARLWWRSSERHMIGG